MLRNLFDNACSLIPTESVLNEVLSLNAQESRAATCGVGGTVVLNEVLSLNAQESCVLYIVLQFHAVLNEVLSLNAQESQPDGAYTIEDFSSMKS